MSASGLTFDTGMLIALERRRQRAWNVYRTAMQGGVRITVAIDKQGKMVSGYPSWNQGCEPIKTGAGEIVPILRVLQQAGTAAKGDGNNVDRNAPTKPVDGTGTKPPAADDTKAGIDRKQK